MRLTTLIVLVVGFCIGVGIRTIYELPIEVALWLLVLAAAIGLVWRRKRTDFSAPVLFLFSLFLALSACGIIRTEITSWQFDSSPLESSLNESVTLTGMIVKEPDVREKTVHLYIKTDSDLLLVTADRLQSFSYGDEVEVSGRLERPESFETELGRTFNYVGYLRARGVEYKISFADVTVIQSGLGHPVISILLSTKQEFIRSIQSVIPEPEVGLGSGLLLGVKSALGEDIEQDFRRTGIIHIVVLSGYNVMLVVAFIMLFFSFLLPLRVRVVAGIISITAFALIVGLSATVVRASIMASLVLFAQSSGRHYNVLRGLLLAGMMMILINPYLLLYDIGFQLSFMATLGLILIVPQFESTVIETSRIPGWRAFLLSTIATQIAVLPLLMYHIGEVSLIAVVVNILVLPIVPFAMLFTFITGLLGFISVSVAGLVGYIATLLLTYILLVAHWFASLPFASVVVPQFSSLGILLSYLGMILLWFYFKIYRPNRDPLAGWTIEIETETADETLDASPKNSLDDTSEIPIFFR